jgi:hypothetical protein
MNSFVLGVEHLRMSKSYVSAFFCSNVRYQSLGENSCLALRTLTYLLLVLIHFFFYLVADFKLR